MKYAVVIALCALFWLTGCARADAWETIRPEEARALLETREDVLLLDVRTDAEYQAGHIPGAILLPVEEIGTEEPASLPDKAQTILVYCRTGRRSAEAARKLAALGYADVRDFGGIVDWPGETVEGDEPGVYPRLALRLTIAGEEVAVEWVANDSVRALQALAAKEPLEIAMHMYGGFEQVGSIGQTLPSEDQQTVTQAGDIVLYSSNQIVIFYGSNSWAYTRLGRVADRTAEQMAALLGSGDVSISLDASPAGLPAYLQALLPEPQEEVTLTFSSFSGGGPEYSVSIDDPAVVSCERDVQSDGPDAPGAGYALSLTFRGLRAGETGVTVTAASPITENWQARYIAHVEKDGRLSLRPTGELESLDFYRGGSMVPLSFQVSREGDGYTLVFDDGEPMPMPLEAADALWLVIEKYDLWRWDGFSGSAEGVLDGEMFSLECAGVHGANLYARGYNHFPPDYFDAMGDLEVILREVAGVDWYW